MNTRRINIRKRPDNPDNKENNPSISKNMVVDKSIEINKNIELLFVDDEFNNNSINNILNSTNTVPVSETCSLLDLLSEVKNNISDLYPEPIWVEGEISGWKKSGKHIYFDLVQRNKSGIEEAKVSAKLWESRVYNVVNKFRKQTNQELVNGMKCEWLVKIDYHPKFGFSVTIEDIKALWTIGEHEKKKLLIKEKLLKEGLYNIQKNISSPTIITSIAVISPNEAAGLGDFKSEADIWNKSGVVNVEYQTAIFEGEKASESIVKAIKYFKSKQTESLKKNNIPAYDVLIILRGGGSKVSLSWMDDYEISKELILFNAPFWSAIGHEQDYCILDEVANKSIHTPSKAAQKISESLYQELKLAEMNIINLKNIVDKKLKHNENLINLSLQSLKNKVYSKIDLCEKELNNKKEYLKKEVNYSLSNLDSNLNNMVKVLLQISPKETMKRGYAVILNKNGKIIKNKKDAEKEKDITIRWENDSLTLNVNNKNKRA